MRTSPLLTLACLIIAPMLVAGGLPKPVLTASGDLSDADRAAFADRFGRLIWPMMTAPSEPEKGCIACHRDDESNTSGLVLTGNSANVLSMLLSDGYFDRGNPSSILSRVAHKKPRYRMPPVPAKPWNQGEVETLRQFVEEMTARRIQEARTPEIDGRLSEGQRFTAVE
jgi:hypothetical protein